MLRGGTVSENKEEGAYSWYNGKITVAKAEEGKPQTVSEKNGESDWATSGGEISSQSSASRRRRSTSK